MIKRPSLHEYLYNILHKKCGVSQCLAGAESWLLDGCCWWQDPRQTSFTIRQCRQPSAVTWQLVTSHKMWQMLSHWHITGHTQRSHPPLTRARGHYRAWIGWNKAVNLPSLDSQIFMVRLSEIIILNKVFCRSFTTSLHSTLHTDGYRTIIAR